MLALPFGLSSDPLRELAAADVDHASEREQSLVAAATVFATRSPASAAPALLAHVSQWPADTAASVPAYVATVSSGDRRLHGQLDDLALRQFASSPNWRTAHAAAFTLLDVGRHDEAAELAWSALDERPDSGMVAHVLAHWHYETGSHSPGRDWLDGWRDGREFTLYKSHFAWHSALHALATGDADGARHLLAQQIDDTAVPDVGSLRWRLRLSGLDVPARDSATQITVIAATSRRTPLLMWSAACGSAADGDADAVERLAATSRSLPLPSAGLLANVLDAFACAAADNWAGCADRLGGITASGIPELGGSHAQREVIEDTLIVALINSERLDEARKMLENRLAQRDHEWDRRSLNATVEQADEGFLQ